MYPERVLAAQKKPIRTSFCATGATTIAVCVTAAMMKSWDWFYQNVRLMKALTQKGYDINYSWGMNLHGQKFGGAILCPT